MSTGSTNGKISPGRQQPQPRFNLAGNLFGGGFLTRKEITSQWTFILYLFFLIIVYISLNLGVEKTQLTERRNQRELKNLKADYTSKAARLQYQSKRGEIESRLAGKGSRLHKPVKPARLIELPD